MGFIDGIRNIGKPKGKVLVITSLGKSRSESDHVPMSQFKILSALNELGPSTVHEISVETGMEEERVKHIAKSMMPDFVKLSGPTE